MSPFDTSLNSAQLPPVVMLMGPTASGKTALSLELSQFLPVEIISVDSAMVYRGMNIGTAKPAIDIRAKIPHHLIDILDPSEQYSAASFRHDVLPLIAEIHQRQHVPLLVGGTMLYYRALMHGLAVLPEADVEIRADLNEALQRQGSAFLHRRLESIDPIAAQRIHPNDPQRIMRALEIYQITGQTMTALLATQPSPALPFTSIALVRNPADRAELHQRIATRFRQMVDDGLVEEVATLLTRPEIHDALPSMRCVGYRQVIPYVRGEWTREYMIERGIVASRQLAKRQLTWLSSWPDCHWLADETYLAEALAILKPVRTWLDTVS